MCAVGDVSTSGTWGAFLGPWVGRGAPRLIVARPGQGDANDQDEREPALEAREHLLQRESIDARRLHGRRASLLATFGHQNMSSTYPTLFGCEAGGGGRVGIAGVPYDRGTDPHRAGCAAAPNTLRRLSSPEQTRMRRGGLYDFARRECIVDGALVSDLGDLPFRVGQNDDAYLALVTSAARVIALEAKKPLFLGGDHLITLSALRGLAQAGHKLQVVQLDAHHDYEPIETGESPMRPSSRT